MSWRCVVARHTPQMQRCNTLQHDATRCNASAEVFNLAPRQSLRLRNDSFHSFNHIHPFVKRMKRMKRMSQVLIRWSDREPSERCISIETDRRQKSKVRTYFFSASRCSSQNPFLRRSVERGCLYGRLFPPACLQPSALSNSLCAASRVNEPTALCTAAGKSLTLTCAFRPIKSDASVR